MTARQRLSAAFVGLVGLGLLTACGPTMADLPLPGNGVSGDTITMPETAMPCSRCSARATLAARKPP